MVNPSLDVLRALAIMQNQCPDEYGTLLRWVLLSDEEQSRILHSSEQPHLLYRAQGGSTELRSMAYNLANASDLAQERVNKRAGLSKVQPIL